MITQRRPLWTTALLASLACTAQSFDWGYSRPGGPAGPHRPGWPPFNGWPGLGPGSGSGSGSGDSGDSGVQIEFCSSSSYAASEYCPEDNPIGGAGTCGNFTVGPNVCCKSFQCRHLNSSEQFLVLTRLSFADTWSDFPNANDTLEGDVKYMYIPNSTEITTCGLYKYVLTDSLPCCYG